MDEEGAKVDVPSKPIVEEGAPGEDCEKSLDEQSKMEDGQPKVVEESVEERLEETESTNQEKSAQIDVVNKSGDSQEVFASDGNVKMAELETDTKEIENEPSEEVTATPDVADDPQVTEESSTPAAEEPLAAPQEDTQITSEEQRPDVPSVEPEASTPEDAPATSQEEPQANISEDGGVSVEQEASAHNQKENGVHTKSKKPPPPKVLPKPKYEPPEIKVDLFVKAHASFPNKLGDCPFCHRIMMILKLKRIGGTVCPVNLSIRSREFEDFCAKHGLPTKVPIIQNGDTVLSDSNAIADYLDKIRPTPKLVCLSKATNAAGDKVFLKFSALVKNKIPSNDAKLAQALTDELSRLNTFLSTSPGCFLDGDDLLHPDCILLPKLHHVRIAAKHYKKYEIPESLQYIHSYLAAADRHPIFASTKPSDDAVIEGWRKHVI